MTDSNRNERLAKAAFLRGLVFLALTCAAAGIFVLAVAALIVNTASFGSPHSLTITLVSAVVAGVGALGLSSAIIEYRVYSSEPVSA